MATGRYLHRDVSYSPLGIRETLVAEGRAGGRSWALVKTEYPDRYAPRPMLVRYSLKVNASEWWPSYGKCFAAAQELARKLLRAKPAGGVVKGVNMENRSPSPWDDGYGTGFWLDATVFIYKSDAERLLKVVETGVDWDSVDYGRLVEELVGTLRPVFDLFSEQCPPAAPYGDF